MNSLCNEVQGTAASQLKCYVMSLQILYNDIGNVLSNLMVMASTNQNAKEMDTSEIWLMRATTSSLRLKSAKTDQFHS